LNENYNFQALVLLKHFMNPKKIIGAAIVATVAIIALRPRKTIPKGAAAVRPFDQKKYLGKWHEIARMDYYWEKHMNNVTATYSLNEDGSVKVDNRGYDYKAKQWKESIGKAKPAGKADEAKLKVSFFGPFYAGYNVIAIDKDYKYALVVGESLDYLWLLSRETTMPEAIRQNYLKLAEAIGYKTAKLVWVEHTHKKEPESSLV
jgi:apolipoprotein D and lipocalin family protein